MSQPVDRTNLEVPRRAVDDLRASEGIVPRLVEEAFDEIDHRLKRLEQALATVPATTLTPQERIDAAVILRLSSALHHVQGILEQSPSHSAHQALPIIKAALEWSAQ
jgi:hypothetical protein